MSGATATVIAAGSAVAAVAVGALWQQRGRSEERPRDPRQQAAERWADVAGRLTAGLDQIAYSPDEATLQTSGASLPSCRGPRGMWSAFGQRPTLLRGWATP
jgi:hypothetical protein